MTKILIVDDSIKDRYNLRRILELEDYEIIESENGEKALDTLDGLDKIDLLITDIRMPRLDGYGLIKELWDRDSKFPILVRSGDFDRGKAEYGGEIDYISKGKSLYDVVAKVKEMLNVTN